MKTSTPKVGLIHSKNSNVIYDQQIGQMVLRIGDIEFQLCPACFRDLSALLSQALKKYDDFTSDEKPHLIKEDQRKDSRLENLLRSQKLNWIRTGFHEG